MYMMSRNYPHLQSFCLKICGLAIFLPEGSHIKTSLLHWKEEALMYDLVYSERSVGGCEVLGLLTNRGICQKADPSGVRRDYLITQ
jgi:hypothetical protein